MKKNIDCHNYPILRKYFVYLDSYVFHLNFSVIALTTLGKVPKDCSQMKIRAMSCACIIAHHYM